MLHSPLPESIPPYASFSSCHDPDFLTQSPSKITLALCGAAPVVGLRVLDESTFPEWLYRLNVLFDAGIYFLGAATHDGPIPLRLTPPDLHLHLGASFDVAEASPAAFDDFVGTHRRRAILSLLSASPIPPRS